LPGLCFSLYFVLYEKHQFVVAMGNLVIVESPAKAKTFQKYLGSDYVVKASFGHIRDLQDKKLSIDINAGFKPEYVVPTDKKKVVNELKKAASEADCVWLASDEDREGEAISWHLCETLGLDPSKTKRIVFHEITKNAIQNAVKNPRTIDMHLVDAQQARRVLDRLVGFELSPVLWRKVQPKLSAGRVQSVALRLVVDKEKEIIAFQSEPYYKVEAAFNPACAPASTQVKAILDTKFQSKEDAEQFLKDCIGARFSVSSIESKEGTRNPAPPFTTSTLQQEAARKLHFSVSSTMRIAQGLYERGLITYMRTDSTNLSSLAIGTCQKFIEDSYGPQYLHTRQYKTHSKGAQEAHEAIRPTFIENRAIEGTPQEQKLYNLIWKRTVASQMAEAKVNNTAIKVSSDRRPEKFNIQASQIIFDGFLKLYKESTDEETFDTAETVLPQISSSEIMNAVCINADCKFTQAPARYSEATLVKKLEELGIGRPSTYATIISTLTTGRGYVVKGDKEGTAFKVTNLSLKDNTITSCSKNESVGTEKGKLLPQEIGIIVCDYLVANFPDVMNYDFTANVEKDFDEIADGKKIWNEVIGQFYSPFHKKIDQTLTDGQYSKVSREIGIDPADGLMITARFGQFGPFVQKGEGENRQYASLNSNQLIESITLEQAIKLLSLPRAIGQYQNESIIAAKGRFGPYLKFGSKNISIPRGMDPLSITLEQSIELIEADQAKVLANTPILNYTASDIAVINGRYGPYIKHAGNNYKIPKGTDIALLTEDACKEIIESSQPTQKSFRRISKK